MPRFPFPAKSYLGLGQWGLEDELKEGDVQGPPTPGGVPATPVAQAPGDQGQGPWPASNVDVLSWLRAQPRSPGRTPLPSQGDQVSQENLEQLRLQKELADFTETWDKQLLPGYRIASIPKRTAAGTGIAQNGLMTPDGKFIPLAQLTTDPIVGILYNGATRVTQAAWNPQPEAVVPKDEFTRSMTELGAQGRESGRLPPAGRDWSYQDEDKNTWMWVPYVGYRQQQAVPTPFELPAGGGVEGVDWVYDEGKKWGKNPKTGAFDIYLGPDPRKAQLDYKTRDAVLPNGELVEETGYWDAKGEWHLTSIRPKPEERYEGSAQEAREKAAEAAQIARDAQAALDQAARDVAAAKTQKDRDEAIERARIAREALAETNQKARDAEARAERAEAATQAEHVEARRAGESERDFRQRVYETSQATLAANIAKTERINAQQAQDVENAKTRQLQWLQILAQPQNAALRQAVEAGMVYNPLQPYSPKTGLAGNAPEWLMQQKATGEYRPSPWSLRVPQMVETLRAGGLVPLGTTPATVQTSFGAISADQAIPEVNEAYKKAVAQGGKVTVPSLSEAQKEMIRMPSAVEWSQMSSASKQAKADAYTLFGIPLTVEDITNQIGTRVPGYNPSNFVQGAQEEWWRRQAPLPPIGAFTAQNQMRVDAAKAQEEEQRLNWPKPFSPRPRVTRRFPW